MHLGEEVEERVGVRRDRAGTAVPARDGLPVVLTSVRNQPDIPEIAAWVRAQVTAPAHSH